MMTYLFLFSKMGHRILVYFHSMVGMACYCLIFHYKHGLHTTSIISEIDSCLTVLVNNIQYTPSVSTIKLSGPTYSSQNVRQIWESTLSKSDYLVGHFYLFFFFLNCKIHQYRIEYNNIITYKTSYNLYSKVQLNLLTIFSNI